MSTVQPYCTGFKNIALFPIQHYIPSTPLSASISHVFKRQNYWSQRKTLKADHRSSCWWSIKTQIFVLVINPWIFVLAHQTIDLCVGGPSDQGSLCWPSNHEPLCWWSIRPTVCVSGHSDHRSLCWWSIRPTVCVDGPSDHRSLCWWSIRPQICVGVPSDYGSLCWSSSSNHGPLCWGFIWPHLCVGGPSNHAPLCGGSSDHGSLPHGVCRPMEVGSSDHGSLWWWFIRPQILMMVVHGTRNASESMVFGRSGSMLCLGKL